MPLAASGVTHQGRRSSNEDAWLVDLALGLLVVADGMGGHNAGEIASALAVKSILSSLSGNGALSPRVRLENALERANEEILEAAAQTPEHAGMGTTVVAALIADGGAFYASVGDSRLYRWHGGQLTQLTRDDSWLAEALADSRAAEFLDAGTHSMRHVLTKVVGLRSDLLPAVGECTLTPGDSLLLCTDGVHGALPRDLLARLLGSQEPVEDIARQVVRSAITHGATDNVTAVVARPE